MFLDLIGIYDLPVDDPQIVFGYISLVHVVALPIYYFHCMHISLILFLILNAIWIVVMIVMICIFATGSKPEYKPWQMSPLSHVLLVVYVTSAILLEIFAYITRNKEVTSQVQYVKPAGSRTSDPGPEVIVTAPMITKSVPKTPPPRPPPPKSKSGEVPVAVAVTPQPTKN